MTGPLYEEDQGLKKTVSSTDIGQFKQWILFLPVWIFPGIGAMIDGAGPGSFIVRPRRWKEWISVVWI